MPNWRQGVGHRALRKKNFRPKCQRGQKSRFEVSELKGNDNFWINLDICLAGQWVFNFFAAPSRVHEVKSSRAAAKAAKVEGGSRWLSFGDWE